MLRQYAAPALAARWGPGRLAGLPRGRGEALAMRCRPCGGVANAHGIWHLVAILSIALTTVAREYGLLIS